MTDAALSVTQSAVERFAEQYLQSLGCDIDMTENRWEVTVPDGANTALSAGDLTLILGEDPEEGDSAESLHSESNLFQQMLSEAGERCPTGKLSIETEDSEVEIPTWLQKSDVNVGAATFTPYYDRTAVVFLFQVSIETVSEYQRELLRAIAVDTRSEESLPRLEETFLRLTSVEANTTTDNHTQLKKSDVRSLTDTARNQLINRTQSVVDEIHEEASRAADAEVEEYRQMQQQRIQELEKKYSNLSSKIGDLSEKINSSDPKDRVHRLKERKDLKSEYDEVDAKLSELRERREQGFPERQREIRERHALDVRTTPLTLTEVEYERGEIEFELIDDGKVHSVTFGYGSGTGITDEVLCSSCGQEFTNQNPIVSLGDGLLCMECS